MENRQTGNAVETRSGEIKVVADADHVRIGVISVNDRICVGTIRRKTFSHKEAQEAQKAQKLRAKEAVNMDCLSLFLFLVPFVFVLLMPLCGYVSP